MVEDEEGGRRKKKEKMKEEEKGGERENMASDNLDPISSDKQDQAARCTSQVFTSTLNNASRCPGTSSETVFPATGSLAMLHAF